ncbi:MAG: glycosyltransferase [Bacteroidia bacterium]|nr:glycosyltransferase [Bacteroidia bacterium]
MQKTIIVVPCFNEASRIDLDAFVKFLNHQPDVFFFFINDGSTDNTSDLIKNYFQNHQTVKVFDLDKNYGKAEAVRHGMLKALNEETAYVGFWDADLSTPLCEIKKFLNVFTLNPSLNLVIGSRVKRLGSDIKRKVLRHYLGRIFSTFASWLTGIEVYDSQCGAKIFRKDIVEVLFSTPFVTRWIFDLEILVRYYQFNGGKNFYLTSFEYPLNVWHEKAGSKLKLKHMLLAPFDLIKIWFHYYK